MPDSLIAITCPTCKSRMKAPTALLGRAAKCPKCNKVLKVIKPEEPLAPMLSLDDEEPQPAGATLKPRDKKLVEPELRLFLIYGVVAVLLFAGLIAGFRAVGTRPANRGADRLTRETFMKIQPGMSHADVKLILGQPTRVLNQHGPLNEPVIYEYEANGGSRRATIVVNPDGNVITKTQTGLD